MVGLRLGRIPVIEYVCLGLPRLRPGHGRHLSVPGLCRGIARALPGLLLGLVHTEKFAGLLHPTDTQALELARGLLRIRAQP